MGDPESKAWWAPLSQRLSLLPLTLPVSPPGDVSGPTVSIPLVMCRALAAWMVVIYVNGMVRIGGILGL